MATTYEAIATVTVGSGGAANIEFTNIPQTYTDLVILTSLRTTNNGTFDDVLVLFNGSTTQQTGRRLFGNGSTVFSNQDTYSVFAAGNTATASTFSNGMTYITNYTGSTNKSFMADSAGENNATEAFGGMTATLWSNTAAITSIKIDPDYGNLVQHSTATLYGIKNS